MKRLTSHVFFAAIIFALGCVELTPKSEKVDSLNKLAFKTAKEAALGESSSFPLVLGSEAVLKAPNGQFLILRVESASKEDSADTSKETARLHWELLHGKDVESGVEDYSILYHKKTTAINNYDLTQVEGSDEFTLGGLRLGWSYGHPRGVWIYPEPGTQYAIREVDAAP